MWPRRLRQRLQLGRPRLNLRLGALGERLQPVRAVDHLVLRRLHHNAPALIDYLSLDVEGAEFQVMRNFPFQSYTFYCVTIERPSAELKSLMISKGYAFASDMPGNFGEVLYVHQTIPGGAPAAIERVNKMLGPILAEQAAKVLAAKKKGR